MKNNFEVTFEGRVYYYNRVLIIWDWDWFWKPLLLTNTETNVKTLFILFVKFQWKY